MTQNDADDYSPLKLIFLGDICLAGGLQQELLEKGSDFPFLPVCETLKSADLVIGNLEYCIAGSMQDIAKSKKNVMTVPAELSLGLLKSGVNVVSLANNHILDGGENGLISTQQFLDKHGIKHFGAGFNLDDAEKPLYIECKKHKVAFLGAGDVPYVFAGENKGGIAPLNAKRLRHRIRACKDHADIVVVVIHADLEFVFYPSPGRVKLSRWLIDEGADLVIQHHPHVCQGIEFHGQGLIAYSLGNFVFKVHGHEYLENRIGTDQGLILQVEFDPSNNHQPFTYEAIPVTINKENQTVLSESDDRITQLSQLAQLSSGLRDQRLLRRERFDRCKKEAKSRSYDLYYTWKRGGFLPMYRTLLKLLASPYERKWMYSLISFGRFE